MTSTEATYDDGGVALDRSGVTIRRYYPWGPKAVPYASIKSVSELPLSGINKVRRFRLWGSGDFVHWWNLDSRRPTKDVALVLDVGRHVRPTITPDDPATVKRLIEEHLPAKG
ncbi:MAG: hypothetical protein J2P57_04430 [Acidimicrobiaceae bacterium]|nr:hypothetical protein [Acidimicrobiaceae bacterium]